MKIVKIALFWVIAFMCTMEEIYDISSQSIEHVSSSDREDTRDLALRLYSLIFEALIRVKCLRDSTGTDEKTRVACQAVERGFRIALSWVSNKVRSIKWPLALQQAAKEYAYVERNVDVVFEEIVLV